MKNYLPAIILILSIISCSCDTTEPPKIEQNIVLTEIDVSVTESFLHVKINSPSPSRHIILLRDGGEVLRISSTNTDTIITDTSLTELTSYSYKAQLVENGTIVGESNTISVQTLQPSSRNFTWQTYTFGDFASSEFNDVAVINENEIWAVGEFFMKDSFGNEISTAFNAAIWNGTEWSKKSLKFKYFYGDLYSDIVSIYSFNMDNILLSSGGSVIKWNGKIWENTDFLFDANNSIGNVQRMWGESIERFYGVGLKGNILKWNGNEWKVIAYNSENNFSDVWGTLHPLKDEVEAYCTIPFDRKILKISNQTHVDSVTWNTGRIPRTIWTNKGFPLVVGGSGIFENGTGEWKEYDLGINFFSTSIRGNGLNDIIAVGSSGFAAHYNGKDWTVFNELASIPRAFQSVSIKEGVVAIAGWEGDKAIVVIGHRN